MRVLEFCRRKDHDVLLDVDEDVREAVAVYAVLAFIDHLQSHLVFKKGLAWLPKDFTFDRACVAAVNYTVDRGVVPHQLVQDDSRPLRQLLLQAVRNEQCDTIYISCRNATRLWANWLLMLLREPATDCCCAAVALGRDVAVGPSSSVSTAEGSSGSPFLRFLHGRYPHDAVLEGERPRGELDHEAFVFAAAYAGHSECLNYLKTSGTMSTLTSRSGHSPLDAAVVRNQPDCVKLLLPRHSPSPEGTLLLALRVGAMDCLQLLARKEIRGRYVRRQLAEQAIRLGNATALQMLVDAETANDVSCTALASAAVAAGHIDCLTHILHVHVLTSSDPVPWVDLAFVAVTHDQLTCLRYVLDNATVDVNTPLSSEGSLLAVAASCGPACLRFLLGLPNVMIDARDRFGATAVHHAAITGQIECLSILIDAGANLTVCDKVGVNPTLTAVRGGHLSCARLLLLHVKSAHCPSMKASEHALIAALKLTEQL